MKPSSTLAVTALVKKMTAEGHKVIGFGAGEPDFDTPQHIKNAVTEALNQGLTKYEPVNGTPAAPGLAGSETIAAHATRYRDERIMCCLLPREKLLLQACRASRSRATRVSTAITEIPVSHR